MFSKQERPAPSIRHARSSFVLTSWTFDSARPLHAQAQRSRAIRAGQRDSDGAASAATRPAPSWWPRSAARSRLGLAAETSA